MNRQTGPSWHRRRRLGAPPSLRVGDRLDIPSPAPGYVFSVTADVDHKVTSRLCSAGPLRPAWKANPSPTSATEGRRYTLNTYAPGRGGAPAARAFTLVELLVVIVIIGILIGLLVPAVGAVRRIAREAACKAVLSAIETGLESYKADGNLGGTYPPSRSDWWTEQAWRVVNPYTSTPPDFPISGAGLLVWALSGADLLGTPGFKVIDPSNSARPFWGNWTGYAYNSGNPTLSDAYAIYPPAAGANAGRPVHPRSGPYVDSSKLKVTQNESRTGTPDFVIPEERKVLGPNALPRAYPMYLDAFGYPVLYWRADPAGRPYADGLPNPPTGSTRGIYHLVDNAGLVGAFIVSGETVLSLNKAKQAHALGWQNGSYTPQNPPPVGYFNRFIMNEAVQARLEPHRPDSYLLVSPGYDGRYGTADDITNFEHHGL